MGLTHGLFGTLSHPPPLSDNLGHTRLQHITELIEQHSPHGLAQGVDRERHPRRVQNPNQVGMRRGKAQPQAGQTQFGHAQQADSISAIHDLIGQRPHRSIFDVGLIQHKQDVGVMGHHLLHGIRIDHTARRVVRSGQKHKVRTDHVQCLLQSIKIGDEIRLKIKSVRLQAVSSGRHAIGFKAHFRHQNAACRLAQTRLTKRGTQTAHQIIGPIAHRHHIR